MKRLLITALSSVLLLSISALAQEVRNEVSVQGTGFFTKDATGNGISRTTTNTGGTVGWIPLSFQPLALSGGKLRLRSQHSKVFLYQRILRSSVRRARPHGRRSVESTLRDQPVQPLRSRRRGQLGFPPD